MKSTNSEAQGVQGAGLPGTYFNEHGNFTQKLVSAPAHTQEHRTVLRRSLQTMPPIAAMPEGADVRDVPADPVTSRYGERRFREGYDEAFFEVLLWLDLGSNFLCSVADSVKAWSLAIDTEQLPVPARDWTESPAVGLCQAEYDRREARYTK